MIRERIMERMHQLRIHLRPHVPRHINKRGLPKTEKASWTTDLYIFADSANGKSNDLAPRGSAHSSNIHDKYLITSCKYSFELANYTDQVAFIVRKKCWEREESAARAICARRARNSSTSKTTTETSLRQADCLRKEYTLYEITACWH